MEWNNTLLAIAKLSKCECLEKIMNTKYKYDKENIGWYGDLQDAVYFN